MFSHSVVGPPEIGLLGGVPSTLSPGTKSVGCVGQLKRWGCRPSLRSDMSSPLARRSLKTLLYETLTVAVRRQGSVGGR